MARIKWLAILGLIAVTCSDAATTLPDPSSPGFLSSPSFSPTSEPPRTEASEVKVPKLVGLTEAKAKSRLEDRGLTWKKKSRVSDGQAPGRVLSQSPKAGNRVASGSTVTITIAKAPKPPPPPPPNCHPSYEGACLLPNASDYDCAGGSGNGPYYVEGPVYVVGPDVFGLDTDGDGVGCE